MRPSIFFIASIFSRQSRYQRHPQRRAARNTSMVLSPANTNSCRQIFFFFFFSCVLFCVSSFSASGVRNDEPKQPLPDDNACSPKRTLCCWVTSLELEITPSLTRSRIADTRAYKTVCLKASDAFNHGLAYLAAKVAYVR